MAYLNPTNEQKAALKDSVRFQNEVEWALLNTANYWKNNDGAGKDAAGAENWYRHRHIGMMLLSNPVGLVTDQEYHLAAVLCANYLIVDDQGFDMEAVITYMIAQDYFAAISDNIFSIKIQTVQF